jgi:hypothetical protein
MGAPVGQVAEWFKAAVLKTAVGVSSPWVRIPLCPPVGSEPERSAGVGEANNPALSAKPYFSGCIFKPSVTLSPKAEVIESTID